MKKLPGAFNSSSGSSLLQSILSPFKILKCFLFKRFDKLDVLLDFLYEFLYNVQIAVLGLFTFFSLYFQTTDAFFF